MATFADIQKVDGPVFTFVGTPIPAGHFTATVTVSELGYVYLLEGKKDDPKAEIKGHVVGSLEGGMAAFVTSDLIGGSYLGEVKSFSEAYAQMV